MIVWTIGLGNLLIGAAYVGLALLSGWEVIHQYRGRGLSRFGLGIAAMAASCGPHHLAHSWYVLHTGIVSTPMLVMTLMGLPAGVVFCSLRAEAMLGGRGDRTVVISPRVAAIVAGAFLSTVGLLVGWSLTALPVPGQIICSAAGNALAQTSLRDSIDVASIRVIANLGMAVSYGMVGWYMLETQIRRFVVSRLWSLSGLSLAAVFPTCAAMHLILALTCTSEAATLPFDVLGVPASFYFLHVVQRLYVDALIDWNHRPAAGTAAIPERSAPWSDSTAA
ncbi:hypothetical protein [Ralstonia insidiosa]|uniref:hypothetical protein n=1 Tax=Ralstonia insidiosa TaxID=190721 RepID=UPI000CEE1B81|nr:hypothetical protein [Ralstonia insidiosa]